MILISLVKYFEPAADEILYFFLVVLETFFATYFFFLDEEFTQRDFLFLIELITIFYRYPDSFQLFRSFSVALNYCEDLQLLSISTLVHSVIIEDFAPRTLSFEPLNYHFIFSINYFSSFNFPILFSSPLNTVSLTFFFG